MTIYEGILRRIRRIERNQRWLQSTNTPGRGESWGRLCSNYLALPQLRGFWPLSSIDENGDARDLSGQGRTLTNTGTAVFAQDTIPAYVELNGTTQYFTRADEAGLDITGTETHVLAAQRGLTMGLWFQIDTTPGASGYGLFSKDQAAANRSYGMLIDTNRDVFFYVSGTGAAPTIQAVSTLATPTDTWTFAAGRFDPSTEVAVWVNDTKTINTTSVPASIYSGGAPLEIGRYVLSQPLDGRVAMAFLCGQMLTDESILGLYRNTKRAFGV